MPDTVNYIVYNIKTGKPVSTGRCEREDALRMASSPDEDVVFTEVTYKPRHVEKVERDKAKKVTKITIKDEPDAPKSPQNK